MNQDKYLKPMLDIAVAYNRFRFLGNEFLTWLWFLMENDLSMIRQCDHDLVSLEVGNRMVLENRPANGLETISIKGDAAGLEEALLALRKGASITELNLIYKSSALQWQFSLKGENLSFSQLKLPESGTMETADDMEGVVLEKIYLYEKPFELVDGLFARFIKLRLASKWQKEIIPRMLKWMRSQEDRIVFDN